jgi:thymidylate synthase
VDEDRLSGVLTQRSCDFPVGVPFNIAFYSAMIYLVASITGLKPYEFIHWTADSHIYVDQIDAVKEYLARPIPDCPQLKITPAETIDDFTMDHFEVIGYNPQPNIKIPVAV